jgi:hypothetical protein
VGFTLLWTLVFASIVSFQEDLTAKGLAISDALLSNRVVIVDTVDTGTNCYNLTVYNVELTPCGVEYVHNTAINELTHLVQIVVTGDEGLQMIAVGLFAI